MTPQNKEEREGPDIPVVPIRILLEQLSEDVRDLRKEVLELRKPNAQLYAVMVTIALATVAASWATFAHRDIVEQKFLDVEKNETMLDKSQSSLADGLKLYATKSDVNEAIGQINDRLFQMEQNNDRLFQREQKR